MSMTDLAITVGLDHRRAMAGYKELDQGMDTLVLRQERRFASFNKAGKVVKASVVAIGAAAYGAAAAYEDAFPGASNQVKTLKKELDALVVSVGRDISGTGLIAGLAEGVRILGVLRERATDWIASVFAGSEAVKEYNRAIAESERHAAKAVTDFKRQDEMVGDQLTARLQIRAAMMEQGSLAQKLVELELQRMHAIDGVLAKNADNEAHQATMVRLTNQLFDAQERSARAEAKKKERADADRAWADHLKEAKDLYDSVAEAQERQAERFGDASAIADDLLMAADLEARRAELGEARVRQLQIEREYAKRIAEINADDLLTAEQKARVVGTLMDAQGRESAAAGRAAGDAGGRRVLGLNLSEGVYGPIIGEFARGLVPDGAASSPAQRSAEQLHQIHTLTEQSLTVLRKVEENTRTSGGVLS